MTNDVDVFFDGLKCKLERLAPKPGDVFVLTVPGHLLSEHAEQIQKNWSEHLPNKLFIVAGGAKIEPDAQQ